jgi:peptide chain release factor 1
VINKLKDIISHYDLLEKQMVDPALINNQSRYTELAKEPRRVKPVILKAKEYLLIQQNIDEDKEILSGEDEELIDIAQGELEGLEQEHLN